MSTCDTRHGRFEAAYAILMKRAGMTQDMLARELLGLSSGSRVSEYLSGRRTPSEAVVRVAEFEANMRRPVVHDRDLYAPVAVKGDGSPDWSAQHSLRLGTFSEWADFDGDAVGMQLFAFRPYVSVVSSAVDGAIVAIEFASGGE